MFIDLTMAFGASTPVYPGDPAIEITPVAALDKDGYVEHLLRCGTHNGTHIDAPSHMIEGGATLGRFGVERFTGKGRLLDIRTGEPNTSTIRPGEIVLLLSGISDDFRSADYFQRTPPVSEQLVAELVRAGVSMVGVDAGSIDASPHAHHKTLLSSDVLLLENLVRLDQLVGREFEIFAFPLAVDLDGAPARVVARVIK